MKLRLYFVLPDLASARQVANDLLLARVEDKCMHFLAKRGTELGELREASYLQKSDIKHGAAVGLITGGLLGIIVGAVVVFNPPSGVTLQLVTILITALGGALLGLWVSSMVGSQVPNSSLRPFQRDIEEGRILLMLDVPRERAHEVHDLVASHHPEARPGGTEPTVPAFP
jgi:hypothetical protein